MNFDLSVNTNTLSLHFYAFKYLLLSITKICASPLQVFKSYLYKGTGQYLYIEDCPVP